MRVHEEKERRKQEEEQQQEEKRLREVEEELRRVQQEQKPSQARRPSRFAVSSVHGEVGGLNLPDPASAEGRYLIMILFLMICAGNYFCHQKAC